MPLVRRNISLILCLGEIVVCEFHESIFSYVVWIGHVCDSVTGEDDYDGGDYDGYDHYHEEEDENEKKSENLKTDIREFFGVSQSRKFRSSKKGKEGIFRIKD